MPQKSSFFPKKCTNSKRIFFRMPSPKKKSNACVWGATTITDFFNSKGKWPSIFQPLTVKYHQASNCCIIMNCVKLDLSCYKSAINLALVFGSTPIASIHSILGSILSPLLFSSPLLFFSPFENLSYHLS